MDFRSVPQLRVVLTKENTETLELASDHSSPKRSRHPRSRRPPARKQKKETDPQCIKKKIVTAQTVVQKKINSDHLLSVDHDVPEPKEMHHATGQYISSQPKVMLTRINSEVFQSLLDHGNNSTECPRAPHPPVSPLVEEETEPRSRLKELETQEMINGHGLPSSEDDDVHQTTCHSSASQPKVVLTRVNTNLLDSLLDHGSADSSKYTQDHPPPPPSAEITETEQLHRSERPLAHLRAQKPICYNFSSSEDDDDEHEPRSRKSGRAVQKDSSENVASFSKESDSSHESSKPNTTSQPKVIELLDSVSDDSSPRWKKRLRVRPPPVPSREILIETEPPIRREKPAVRLVTQKKINYRASSSSEEENEKYAYNTHRRKAVGKDSESDATFSDKSESSDEVWNPKMDTNAFTSKTAKQFKYVKFSNRQRRCRRKKVTESQLKKEAITGGNRSLSEYEKQRMKNIEQKLAFLESLKTLGDEVNAESFKDN